MLKLYNTLTRKLEEFRPAGEVVKIYTCGPTVYNYQHIGNFAAFVYWDLLVRTLRAEGLAVRRVLNLTDVGHLVSDGDEGEDKLEKGAAREGKSVWKVAEYYIKDFLDNYRALELTQPEVVARATDYIEADERAVDLMSERGFTYETHDGVYFDTAKFGGYADFARLDLSGLSAGARVTFSDEKRGASDLRCGSLFNRERSTRCGGTTWGGRGILGGIWSARRLFTRSWVSRSIYTAVGLTTFRCIIRTRLRNLLRRMGRSWRGCGYIAILLR